MEVDQQERLRDLTRIDDIVHHPEAAKFIAEAKGAAKGGTPGEEMLKAVEAFMPAVRASTEMGQEFGVKLGLKAEAARSGHLANTPFAYGVLSLLCAIAQARG
ncbi:MAG: hypothetical protein MI723_18680, partial [Caulobacterales bacterium]|nr:hypothetical protein [Caulobacterales bacterium]